MVVSTYLFLVNRNISYQDHLLWHPDCNTNKIYITRLIMSKKRTIESFFKPKEDINDSQVHPVREDVHNTRVQPERNDNIENPPDVEPDKIDRADSLIRDPGERHSILSYPSNQRDEIRRLYIKLGPYQLEKSKYPFSPSGAKGCTRSFQRAWFKKFWWLEYSEKRMLHFVFLDSFLIKKPIGRAGSDTFTVSGTYPLFDRLIRLILTLPVSTATSERAFSAMKIVKKRLRNTMSDDFLKNCLLVNTEREIVDTFSTDTLIDDFYSMKQRRAQLKVRKVTG
ncbi:hypothetical protein LXL04_030277 [Taraxacum kok-saghyz]